MRGGDGVRYLLGGSNKLKIEKLISQQRYDHIECYKLITN